MNFLTYPARPISGGDRPRVPTGDWLFSPKMNGWRVLVHVPTRTMWNRHGNKLTIREEFDEALDMLTLASPFEWVDCEALERRHNIGKGSLIILDVVDPNLTFSERKGLVDEVFPQLEIRNNLIADRNSVYSVPEWEGDPLPKWREMKRINEELKCEYLEGLVMKAKDSMYPIQKVSAEDRTWEWVKFRFV